MTKGDADSSLSLSSFLFSLQMTDRASVHRMPGRDFRKEISSLRLLQENDNAFRAALLAFLAFLAFLALLSLFAFFAFPGAIFFLPLHLFLTLAVFLGSFFAFFAVLPVFVPLALRALLSSFVGGFLTTLKLSEDFAKALLDLGGQLVLVLAKQLKGLTERLGVAIGTCFGLGRASAARRWLGARLGTHRALRLRTRLRAHRALRLRAHRPTLGTGRTAHGAT